MTNTKSEESNEEKDRKRRRGNNGTYITLISSKPVIDPRRQDYQIFLFHLDAHPFVAFVTHVEVSLSVKNVADFFILMQVLIEEHFNFLLIYLTHSVRGHYNLITILVPALGSNRIDI